MKKAVAAICLIVGSAFCLPLISRAAGEPITAAPNSAALTNLVFDNETQIYNAKPGERQGSFSFSITNFTDVPVHILGIPASCGCTRAELPQTPWIIPAHTNETLHVKMDVNGLPGENLKYLTIISTNGTKQIWVKTITAAPPAPAATNATPAK